MNRQEIYTTVRNHLLTQNAKSVGLDAPDDEFSVSNCLYRGDNGLKCAVGCLIKDEFCVDIEGFVVTNGRVIEALAKSGVADLTDRTLEMLGELQYVHDHLPVGEWKVRLNEIATRYDVKVEDTPTIEREI